MLKTIFHEDLRRRHGTVRSRPLTTLRGRGRLGLFSSYRLLGTVRCVHPDRACYHGNALGPFPRLTSLMILLGSYTTANANRCLVSLITVHYRRDLDCRWRIAKRSLRLSRGIQGASKLTGGNHCITKCIAIMLCSDREYPL
jgi:hypothetical protein